MKKAKYILLVMGLVSSFTLSAQASNMKTTELRLSAFYGLSSLSGSLPEGSIATELNPQFVLEGTYFFSNSIGAGLGIGYANYTASAKLNVYSSAVAATDEDGDNLEYRIKASGIEEKEKVSAFEVPLFIAFRHSISAKLQFEANTGVKISVPVSSSYVCQKGTITTTGFYETYNAELANLPDHGFQTVTEPDYLGKLSTNAVFSLFAKAGVMIPMGAFGLHIGAYGSCGLNSVLKSESDVLVSYPGIYYPVSSLCKKVTLIGGGVKIGLSW
jgi:hypothetical protein